MSRIHAVPQWQCDRCGDLASVVNEDIPLCGQCFLGEALRRRREAAPLRFRKRRVRHEARVSVASAVN
jgi:hypothetical protein